MMMIVFIMIMVAMMCYAVLNYSMEASMDNSPPLTGKTICIAIITNIYIMLKTIVGRTIVGRIFVGRIFVGPTIVVTTIQHVVISIGDGNGVIGD